MTRQYVAGELSVILGQLQTAAAGGAASGLATRLRHEVETTPAGALGSVAVRAMELTDGACWDSLMHGEIATFVREAAICAELWEFGICAGLLDEEDPPVSTPS